MCIHICVCAKVDDRVSLLWVWSCVCVCTSTCSPKSMFSICDMRVGPQRIHPRLVHGTYVVPGVGSACTGACIYKHTRRLIDISTCTCYLIIIQMKLLQASHFQQSSREGGDVVKPQIQDS